MKWLRSCLSFIFFYVFGLFSGLILCGALFLYVAISWLHQPYRSDNENVRQLLQWGQFYSQEMNLLEDLQTSIEAGQSELCAAVCNPSTLSTSEVVESGATFLLQYQKAQPKQALQDPFFLLAMNKTEVLKEVFPRPLREAILQEQSSSKLTRVYRAFQLEWDLLVHAGHLATEWQKLKMLWDQSESYQELIETCRTGLKPKPQVVLECSQAAP